MLDAAGTERALRGAPWTAAVAFTVDGVVSDPGVVSVVVTRADGTQVTAAYADGTGAAPRTFALTSGMLSELDVLSVAWTSATLGKLTSRVEVVGGYLFSLAEARSMRPLDDTVKYPASAVVAARLLAESALEDACNVAFVPRYQRERVNGSGTASVFLRRARPTRVITATIDGTALTAPQIAAVDVTPDGCAYRPDGWPAGRRNITLGYEHGYPACPARVARAALLLAKRYLVESPVNDRATSLVNDDGTTQYLVTAGTRSAVFDIPEANAVVQQYREITGIA